MPNIVAVWRILIICAAGIAVSGTWHVERQRKRDHDDLAGDDLARCLRWILVGTMVGMATAVTRHIAFTWALPFITYGLYRGVRARVRWYLTRERQEDE